MIFKFLELQFKQPTRGDWASTCIENLKQLDISETLDEFKRMTRNKFINILNERIKNIALKYLLERQGQKGSEVEHLSIRVADYLSPNNTGLTIADKQDMFSVINRMVKISYNFPHNQNIEYCCGQVKIMEHIYNCKLLNP